MVATWFICDADTGLPMSHLSLFHHRRKCKHVVNRANIKASVQSFCFIFKLSPLEPTKSPEGPGSC